MTYTISESPREAYDKIVAYFSRPGAAIAYSEEDSLCMYRLGRDADGAACAVGCLIPDEAYTPEMDHVSYSSGISELVHRGQIAVPNADTLLFLKEAQVKHDESRTASGFLIQLKGIALRRGIIND